VLSLIRDIFVKKIMTEIERIDKLFIDFENKDGKIRYEALQNLIDISENKVSWI
jgi:hypothetical protein